MNQEKIEEVVEKYRAKFKSLGIKKVDYPHGEIVCELGDVLGYCYKKLDDLLILIKNDDTRGKSFQIVGFCSGLSLGFKSL